ncbi:uncharacterized protein DSM5745_05529 [Aspergillus mulundensis]|uniref:Major facilitator superfamily (MFS) profile domain-containing protein n=1 Tax=Aspergillus mulundensis TaxID=1810919 RepID=A0A3D8RX86_9EURO|nr:Uncharacterized protein DSM5745_05529 [Aspergillus mulundensis]RDW78677.1 Uncharacterized protein DSM5745_05529 [Aspergillus mulundensis]
MAAALSKDKSNENEHRENVIEVNRNQLDEEILYESKGLAGLIRSPYVCGACVLAASGGFSFGYDQGVISLILVMQQFRDYYPEVAPEHPRYGFNTGFMTAMLELGAFLGCLFMPMVADRFSRKRALAVATVIFCVGAVIQTAASNYGALVAGRTIGGIGVGSLAMTSPLWISEVAPPNLRGSLLVMESISIVVGATVAYWMTYGTRLMDGHMAFRLPLALQVIPALVVGVGIQFFPYSPRWLAMRHRDGDCLRALMKLRRLPETDERVRREWKGILAEVRFQEVMQRREHGVDNSAWGLELKEWRAMFAPKYVRQTIVALGISFFQQFSGINAFVYYAPTFVQAMGQSYETSLILSGMVNVFQFVGNLPTFFFLDQMGRRPIAIFGGLAMSIPHFIMAGVVGKYAGNWSAHPAMGWFGVALIYIYVVAYAATYGPLAWALPSEIFPSHKRAKGVGAASAMIWLANFIVGVTVPEMLIALGWGTYLFFGCFCLGAAVFSYFLVPETAGRSLEQVSLLFGERGGGEEGEVRRRIAGEIWGGDVMGKA